MPVDALVSSVVFNHISFNHMTKKYQNNVCCVNQVIIIDLVIVAYLFFNYTWVL